MKTKKRDIGIWLVDKERKYLILKFSAGKYRNMQGEFSSPNEFLEDRSHSKTDKPVIANDVVPDSRIKYSYGAKKEKPRSFAGYSLTYDGEVVRVMAMFSEQHLLPADLAFRHILK